MLSGQGRTGSLIHPAVTAPGESLMRERNMSLKNSGENEICDGSGDLTRSDLGVIEDQVVIEGVMGIGIQQHPEYPVPLFLPFHDKHFSFLARDAETSGDGSNFELLIGDQTEMMTVFQ